MKKIGLAIVLTALIFFVATLVIAPIISNMGYSSADASYHLQTHALIVALIFTVIVCTLIILGKIDEIKDSRFDF